MQPKYNPLPGRNYRKFTHLAFFRLHFYIHRHAPLQCHKQAILPIRFPGRRAKRLPEVTLLEQSACHSDFANQQLCKCKRGGDQDKSFSLECIRRVVKKFNLKSSPTGTYVVLRQDSSRKIKKKLSSTYIFFALII